MSSHCFVMKSLLDNVLNNTFKVNLYNIRKKIFGSLLPCAIVKGTEFNELSDMF